MTEQVWELVDSDFEKNALPASDIIDQTRLASGSLSTGKGYTTAQKDALRRQAVWDCASTVGVGDDAAGAQVSDDSQLRVTPDTTWKTNFAWKK